MPVDFSSGSALTQILAAFNAGLLTSFTPCIYPLIPITLAIFGAQESSSRMRSFLLAASYVGGIAVTYTCLGMLSAKTGSIFGSFLSKPEVVLGLTCFLLALALFSLDALKFGSISKVQNLASSIGGKGFRGAFLMGTVSGFVAAPCAGPMLVVILSIAAAQQNTVWGAVLLFTYSVGMGMLFLLLGLFPGLLKKLPRSGNWLHVVKFVMAVLLILVIFFIAQPYHEKLLAAALRGNWPLLSMLTAAGFLAAWTSYRKSVVTLRVLAAFAVAAPIFYVVVPAPAASSAADHSLEWEGSLDAGLAKAAANGSIAMVDIFADWCAACKELEAKTFSNPQVQDQLKRVSLARVNFSVESAANDALTERFSVLGLPCVLFLKPDGSEIPETRVTGFLEPKEFMAVVQKALSASGSH